MGYYLLLILVFHVPATIPNFQRTNITVSYYRPKWNNL